MDRPKELEREKFENKYAEQAQQQAVTGAIGMTLDSTNYMQPQAKAAVPQHPRDILLSDLNDQEQRLLDKIAALRELRQELLFLGRDEGERILKIARLQQRVQGI